MYPYLIFSPHLVLFLPYNHCATYKEPCLEFQFLIVMSICTNCVLLVCLYDQEGKWKIEPGLAAILIMEHVLLLIKYVFSRIIPEVKFYLPFLLYKFFPSKSAFSFQAVVVFWICGRNGKGVGQTTRLFGSKALHKSKMKQP